jgi:hypothetical protein
LQQSVGVGAEGLGTGLGFFEGVGLMGALIDEEIKLSHASILIAAALLACSLPFNLFWGSLRKFLSDLACLS